MCYHDGMALSTLERLREQIRLRRFRSLTDQEIATHLGTTDDALKKGRYRNLEALTREEKDEVNAYQPAPTNLPPSADDLRWRFKHQSAAQIWDRFESSIRVWWGRIGVESEAPDELKDLLAAQAITGVLRKNGDEFEVACGPFTLSTPLEVAAQTLDMKVRQWYDEYDIPDARWGEVRNRLLAILRALEWLENKAITTSQLKDAEASLRAASGQLPFPKKGAQDAAEYMRMAVEDAQVYAAENGYRETVCCGGCGTKIALYLNLYRHVAEEWLESGRVLSGEISSKEAFQWAKARRAKVAEHPFLTRQLRDLGCAWSAPLLRHLVALHNEFPDLIPKSRVYEIAGDVLEVSPALFDERVPFSPLNRVVETEDGLLVTEPSI